MTEQYRERLRNFSQTRLVNRKDLNVRSPASQVCAMNFLTRLIYLAFFKYTVSICVLKWKMLSSEPRKYILHKGYTVLRREWKDPSNLLNMKNYRLLTAWDTFKQDVIIVYVKAWVWAVLSCQTKAMKRGVFFSVNTMTVKRTWS